MQKQKKSLQHHSSMHSSIIFRLNIYILLNLDRDHLHISVWVYMISTVLHKLFSICKIVDLLKLNAFSDQKLYATCTVLSVLG